MAQEYYDLEKTAGVLRLSTGEVNRLRERSELRAFRDGSSWKFKRDEVEKYLADQIKGRGSAATGSANDELGSELGLGPADDLDLSEAATMMVPRAGAANEIMVADDDLVLAEDGLQLAGSETSAPITLAKPAVKEDTDFGGLSLASVDDLKLEGESFRIEGDSDLVAPASQPTGKPSTAPKIDISEDSSFLIGGDDSGANDLQLTVAVPKSAAGSGLNLAGDSSLSLVYATEPAKKSVSDDVLELAEDDDILMLMTDASVLAKPASKFQLTPSTSHDTDESESTSQVIAIDEDDPLFMADSTDMFSVSDSSSPSLQKTGKPAAKAASSDSFGFDESIGSFDDSSSGDPFGSSGGGAAVSAAMTPSANMDTADFAPTPPTRVSSAVNTFEATYSGVSVGLMAGCLVFLTLGVMLGFDMVRHMWSWGQPFVLNSVIMDMFAGK